MKAEARARMLLKAAGILAYEPGQHTGECKAPYVVVHRYGNYQTIESARLRYSLLLLHCYVPITGDQTAALSALVDQTKTIMTAMATQARPTGREEPDMIDDTYKALTRSIEYQVLLAGR